VKLLVTEAAAGGRRCLDDDLHRHLGVAGQPVTDLEVVDLKLGDGAEECGDPRRTGTRRQIGDAGPLRGMGVPRLPATAVSDVTRIAGTSPRPNAA
jgi:hypothetical protein